MFSIIYELILLVLVIVLKKVLMESAINEAIGVWAKIIDNLYIDFAPSFLSFIFPFLILIN